MTKDITDKEEGANSSPAAASSTPLHPRVLSIPVTRSRYIFSNNE